MIWIDIASWILLIGGGFFCVVGGVGLLRLPDFFTRCHGAGITDTMGAGMILTGLMIQAGDPLIVGKLVLLLVFIFLTSPVAGHALVKAAYAGGYRIEQPLEDHTGGDVSAPSAASVAEEAPTIMLDASEEDA
jgi:multicomponent Na+:H+ antiporter subunit G